MAKTLLSHLVKDLVQTLEESPPLEDRALEDFPLKCPRCGLPWVCEGEGYIEDKRSDHGR
jgi:hypothetical protein